MKQLRALILLLATVVSFGAKAQISFDPQGGCLNVIDFSKGFGIGGYGDGCVSVNYLHEVFKNEQFSIGGGISRNVYRDKFLNSFGINIGVCFQINGW